MVLDGEDERVGRGEEGALVYGVDHLAERYLGGERVSMVDHGVTVVPVPAVELETAAPGQEHLEEQRKMGQ